MRGQASTNAIADFFQSGPPTTSPQRQESRPSEGPQRLLLQSDIETASHESVQEAMSYLQDSGISVSEEAMCRLVAEKLAVRPLRSFARCRCLDDLRALGRLHLLGRVDPSQAWYL